MSQIQRFKTIVLRIGRGTEGDWGQMLPPPPNFFQNWKMCPFSEIKMPFL